MFAAFFFDISGRADTASGICTSVAAAEAPEVECAHGACGRRCRNGKSVKRNFCSGTLVITRKQSIAINLLSGNRKIATNRQPVGRLPASQGNDDFGVIGDECRELSHPRIADREESP